ncbi:hypothetical protein GGR54DRAFT_587400 [Hypoxylon sp. NC1633]|nr:hypothetical protein GGR54DRAFT_587400 [Hypoxylon sp. NC1633]
MKQVIMVIIIVSRVFFVSYYYIPMNHSKYPLEALICTIKAMPRAIIFLLLGPAVSKLLDYC